MRKTRSLSVTLPHRMAQMVKQKVKSGAYATESEVIRAGLRALDAQESAVEEWLRTEGLPDTTRITGTETKAGRSPKPSLGYEPTTSSRRRRVVEGLFGHHQRRR